MEFGVAEIPVTIDMPIYKISRRGSSERRARVRFSRLRLAAVLLSCLFIVLTIMLLRGRL